MTCRRTSPNSFSACQVEAPADESAGDPPAPEIRTDGHVRQHPAVRRPLHRHQAGVADKVSLLDPDVALGMSRRREQEVPDQPAEPTQPGEAPHLFRHAPTRGIQAVGKCDFNHIRQAGQVAGADRRAASRCGGLGAQRRQRSPRGLPSCLDRRPRGHPAAVLAAFGLGSRHPRESFTPGSVACRKFVDPLPSFFTPTPCPREAARSAAEASPASASLHSRESSRGRGEVLKEAGGLRPPASL